MSDVAGALAYIAKADRALAGAHLLLESGDAEGACNRSYYAMFDAAHAALLVFALQPTDVVPKTHGGLIAAFGKHLVQGGIVDAELGRSLNKVFRLRQLADYTGDAITLADATWACAQAESFLRIIEHRVGASER